MQQSSSILVEQKLTKPLLGPISSLERIHLIDVLRGFALFGILLANIFWWFNGLAFFDSAHRSEMTTAPLDAATYHFVRFFVTGKFPALFTLLFGLGFAIQIMRAEERGASIVPTHLRRMLALLLIALAHMFLLWYGDILHGYALMGFLLILFRRCKDKTLITWGLVFAFLAPMLLSIVRLALPLIRGVSSTPPTAAAGPTLNEHLLITFAEGSYLEILRTNASYILSERLRINSFSSASVLLIIYMKELGKFLIGFYAGRQRLFHNVSAHLDLFRKLLWWSLCLEVLCAGMVILRPTLMRVGIVDNGSLWRIIFLLFNEVGTLALGLFYVSVIVLIYQQAVWRKRLLVLAPVGRMALTNYLFQSVICIFIFYGVGLGMIGEMRPSVCVLTALAIYIGQILISTWWLKRFQFGPMEWLWRTLTYGKTQTVFLPRK